MTRRNPTRHAQSTLLSLILAASGLAGCSSSSAASPFDAGIPSNADSGLTTPDAGTSPSPSSDGGNAQHDDAGPTTPDAASEADAASFNCTPNTGGCTCVVSPTGTSTEGSCPASTIPNPLCCAGIGFPESEFSTCSCQNYACTNIGAGLCMCAIDTTGTKTGSTCTGTYAHCCENVLSDNSINSCSCGAAPCESGDTEVPSCSVAELTCTGTTRVSSCH